VCKHDERFFQAVKTDPKRVKKAGVNEKYPTLEQELLFKSQQ
jgi:hypothetical protein